jgi:hypothetical protein
MAVQSVSDPDETGHMIGDVPALLLVAIVLAVLLPRRLTLPTDAAPPRQ